MVGLTFLRRWVVIATIACLAAGGARLAAQETGRPVRPSDPKGRGGRQISLRDQLRVGLKAVTDADFAFIDLVVTRVNQNVLPKELVNSTFLYARKRVETRDGRYLKRPMVYFQPALVLRARALGVAL